MRAAGTLRSSHEPKWIRVRRRHTGEPVAAEDSAQIPARQTEVTAERRVLSPITAHQPASERFAALIVADREAILTSFRQHMEKERNPVVRDPRSWERAETLGSQIVTDVAKSVRS